MNQSLVVANISAQVVASLLMGVAPLGTKSIIAAVLASGAAYFIPGTAFAELSPPTTPKITIAYVTNEPTSSVLAGALSGFVAARYL